MKALKNGSAAYTKQIIFAIQRCYAGNVEPINSELMELYSFIGKCICAQGEKAFVVHLAQSLAEQLPQVKGFSPRNLRRMRDFYRTYESQPQLMQKAQTLGWTQNAVILDCCESDEQRAFYITLAAKEKLSKLALMKAIEAGAFEAAEVDETIPQKEAERCAAVCDCTAEQGVDTASATNQPCGTLVTPCEPSRQGSRLHADDSQDEIQNSKQKRSSNPTPNRAAELLKYCANILYGAGWRWRLFVDRPPGQPPSWWCNSFEMREQCPGIA